jgi:hypothetical protein
VTTSIDGFYAAYLSSKVGQGFALLVLRKGKIVGVDVAGTKMDGRYADDANNLISVTLVANIPPNIPLLQGGMSGPQGESNELSFQMPPDFENQPFIRIETKHGPVNAKLVKLRGIDD